MLNKLKFDEIYFFLIFIICNLKFNVFVFLLFIFGEINIFIVKTF